MMRASLATIPAVALLGQKWRAWQQQRYAARIAAAYTRQAASRQIAPLDESALVQALRLRVRNRLGQRVKKKDGLHIFLAYCVTNWEAILPRALSVFGKVSAFNWRELGFDDLAEDWLKHRDGMNHAMLAAFRKENAVRKIDVVVGYLSGNNTSPETLQEMSEAGAVIFNFCWDDKLHFPGKMRGGRYTSPAAIAHAVDLNLTNAPDSVLKYAVHGGLAMFWPEAAHPEVHRPYDVPFEFDVSFVGAKYGWRPRFINRLNQLGVTVDCFGKGWPRGSLSDEEMVRLYSRSRINLGFAGIGHSRKLMCLKNRDFEVPMSGGLYLTQDNPELGLVYDVGNEIVTFSDEIDCARKIRWLLENPARAAEIRAAGRKRALKDHTYERRWERVFRMAGLLD